MKHVTKIGATALSCLALAACSSGTAKRTVTISEAEEAKRTFAAV